MDSMPGSATQSAAGDDKAKLDIISGSIESEFKCSVCLGVVIKANAVVPCGHLFCKYCISTWMNSIRTNCPMCRAHATSSLPVGAVDSVVTNYYKCQPESVREERLKLVIDRLQLPLDQVLSHTEEDENLASSAFFIRLLRTLDETDNEDDEEVRVQIRFQIPMVSSNAALASEVHLIRLPRRRTPNEP